MQNQEKANAAREATAGSSKQKKRKRPQAKPARKQAAGSSATKRTSVADSEHEVAAVAEAAAESTPVEAAEPKAKSASRRKAKPASASSTTKKTKRKPAAKPSATKSAGASTEAAEAKPRPRPKRKAKSAAATTKAKKPKRRSVAKPATEATATIESTAPAPEAAPAPEPSLAARIAKLVPKLESVTLAKSSSSSSEVGSEQPVEDDQVASPTPVEAPSSTPADEASSPADSESLTDVREPVVEAISDSKPAATGPKHLAIAEAPSAAAEKIKVAKDKVQDTVSRIPAREALAKLRVWTKALIARLRTLPRQAWIAVGIVVGVYLLGCVWFLGHFLPRTSVNGVDVSGMSQGAFEDLANEMGDDYKVQIKGDGVNITIDADDIDLAYDGAQYAQSAFAQNHVWSWPVGVFLEHDISANSGVDYDEKALKSYVSTAVDEVNAYATPPQNASLSYDEGQKSFVATASIDGTKIDAKAALAKVERGVKSLREKVELGENELEQPSVLLDDTRINAAIVQANNRANLSFDLILGGEVVSVVDKDQVRSWMTLGDACEVIGNAALIEEYTRGTLSAELDTVGTMRTYTRPDDGKQVQVYGGTYGWSIDGTSLAKLIADRITKNSDEPIEIPTLSEGYTWIQGGQDWGPGYIDVDLGEQIVRMYDESGNLSVLTYCVTGDTATNNGTITGVYSIQEKASPKKLVGLDSDHDGQPDYENDVNYWMSFFGGYGLHDALWRDLFGGTVFQGAGSHGCVNLPYTQAQLMYNSVYVGYPVVVHL